jgi:hypothetical protein
VVQHPHKGRIRAPRRRNDIVLRLCRQPLNSIFRWTMKSARSRGSAATLRTGCEPPRDRRSRDGPGEGGHSPAGVEPAMWRYAHCRRRAIYSPRRRCCSLELTNRPTGRFSHSSPAAGRLLCSVAWPIQAGAGERSEGRGSIRRGTRRGESRLERRSTNSREAG